MFSESRSFCLLCFHVYIIFVFFFEIFDLRRYFCYVGTSAHFVGKSALERLKSGLELKFVIILYFRVYVYMRLCAFCFMQDCFL